MHANKKCIGSNAAPSIRSVNNVRTFLGHIPTSDDVWTEICITSWTSDGLEQLFSSSETGTGNAIQLNSHLVAEKLITSYW